MVIGIAPMIQVRSTDGQSVLVQPAHIAVIVSVEAAGKPTGEYVVKTAGGHTFSTDLTGFSVIYGKINQ